jgi:hypothetical protein
VTDEVSEQLDPEDLDLPDAMLEGEHCEECVDETNDHAHGDSKFDATPSIEASNPDHDVFFIPEDVSSLDGGEDTLLYDTEDSFSEEALNAVDPVDLYELAAA